MFCQKKQKNETLPPTSDSLRQHIRRANYQTYLWRSSLDGMQEIPSPVGHGWLMEDGELKPLLMTKDLHPKAYWSLQHALARSRNAELTVPALMSVFPAQRPALVWQRKRAVIHTGCNGKKMISADSNSDNDD